MAATGTRHNGQVSLEGWSKIPEGYGASFEVNKAPWWLKLWFHTPFIDRYAYPLLVQRGHGVLRAHPGVSAAALGPVSSGWRIVGTDEDSTS